MVAPQTAPASTTQALHVPLAAWLAVAVALFAVHLVLHENGALLASSWETLHELFHDGRHALGVPCH